MREGTICIWGDDDNLHGDDDLGAQGWKWTVTTGDTRSDCGLLSDQTACGLLSHQTVADVGLDQHGDDDPVDQPFYVDADVLIR